MHLEGALRTTLTALALAAALCLRAEAQSPTVQQSAPPALPAQGAGGMAAYEGLIVQTINFPDVPAANAQHHLLDLIPQKAGVPLKREDVRESIQALHSTGRFADIQVEAERSLDHQVVLAFRTQANFFVGEIFVEAAPNPPAANQVVNASKLQLGELFTREKLERAIAGIKQLMEQNGYYKSSSSDEELAHPRRSRWTSLFGSRPDLMRKLAA